MNPLQLFRGYRTYIIAVLVLVIGGLQGLGVWHAPDWLWPLLAAGGLGSLRAAVDQVSQQVKDTAKK